MAIQILEPARPGKGKAWIEYYGEQSGETFKQFEMVVADSAGQITACADDATTILGMVLADATGTQGTKLPVAIATDTQRFVMNVYHVTPGSALSAESLRDNKFGLEVDSNRHYVDIAQASADALMIVSLIDPAGDRYGKVNVVVLAEAQQLGAGGT